MNTVNAYPGATLSGLRRRSPRGLASLTLDAKAQGTCDPRCPYERVFS